ncbi:MAG: TraR/DksA C4-type zinc finger protein [Patescibacteria group bacterium]|nr:TraR/DksA C4-type zinc finger protein [Patescibacteria group bacterium]MCL5257744.1 TraR/DksA C4-type zinc finger protein [Patescibacteria group bacterium]
MSDNLSEIKKKLLKEKEEIELVLKELQTKNTVLNESEEITSEVSDAAEHYEEKDLAFSQTEFVKKRLEQIDNALDRIEKGIYGVCLKCQKQIEPARLQIDPTIETCRFCSSKS